MDTLTKYQNACEDLAIAFYHKYYQLEASQGECFEWLHDVGDTFTIDDQCFNPYEMMEAIRLNATKTQLLGWYYDNMHACCGRGRISLRVYLNGKRTHNTRPEM